MDILIEKKAGKILRPDEVKETLSEIKDGYYMLSLTKGAKRTLEQNAYYWRLLTIVGNDIGYETEELHEVFTNMFLKKTVIHEAFGELQVVTSTTKLTTKTFTEYVEKIRNRCAENGYVIPMQ